MEKEIKDKKLQILISAVNKDPIDLLKRMNIQTDACLVDQILSEEAKEKLGFTGFSTEVLKFGEHDVKVIKSSDKGVGLSRNTALENSDPDAGIIQFADDDIVYNDGYDQLVLREFEKHPEADILLFNVKAQPGRETYWNTDYAKVSRLNYGRYPAYAICARRQKLIDSGVKYSLLFGGGAPYMNGEDSLFLHDCLEKKLSICRTDVTIGHETTGESTWFKGYTEKFFFDRGVLYHFLYGKMAILLGFRFLFNNRNKMCSEYGFLRAYGVLCKGIAHGKTLKQ